jgi:hypothetical protein
MVAAVVIGVLVMPSPAVIVALLTLLLVTVVVVEVAVIGVEIVSTVVAITVVVSFDTALLVGVELFSEFIMSIYS